ncbi:MAG: hypothetical protein ACLQSR_14280 [Limisphaerales bacterium]
MSKAGYDPIRPWFLAGESLGEFIGMRFARIPPGKTEPDWIYVRHCDYDGIGAIGMMFEERGAKVELPQARHPAKPSFRSFFKLVGMQLRPRKRLKWKNPGNSGKMASPPEPAPAAAWHVFNEADTLRMRKASNAAGVTVNSFLLFHLTATIRPYLEDAASAPIPWMIPVNMRGRVISSGDRANQTSYLSITVLPSDSVRDIHQSAQAAMDREDHCTNWYGYGLGRFIPQPIMKFLIANELATSQWNSGAFSNLGAWDSEKKITSPECLGDWLFCPPVLRFQSIGAGCITFQNRLSLLIQAHPELTTNAAVCRAWIKNWVMAIENDLAKSDAHRVLTAVPA